MKHLVSIIIPTFNRKDFLPETLKSVSDQTYENWECIIIDDGSTDGTSIFMQEYCERNLKFKYFQRPINLNGGASSCRNLGIKFSKGEYIQFLDSDDLLGINKLEEQIKFLENEKGDVLLTCKWGFFSDESDMYRRFKYEYHSYQNFHPAHKLVGAFGKYKEFLPLHVYLFPKRVIEKIGGWNEQLTNNDDAEFFLRVILAVSRIIFVPSAEVFYRLHTGGTALSDLDSKDKFLNAIRSWELMEVYLKNIGKEKVGSKYIKSGKLMIYNRAHKKYPDLIWDNYCFFKSHIPLRERLLKKIF